MNDNDFFFSGSDQGATAQKALQMETGPSEEGSLSEDQLRCHETTSGNSSSSSSSSEGLISFLCSSIFKFKSNNDSYTIMV
jgi:hypothetical protein